MSRMDRAAEYVLGLLDEEDRVLVEAEMASDGELARAVASLQSNLHALDETAVPADIPEGLWEAINKRIAETPQAVPANTIQRTGSGSFTGMRRAAMAASVLVALGIGFAGGTLIQPAAPAPVVVAVLVGDDLAPGAIIEAFGDDSVRIIPLEALIAPQGNTLEVWTLPDAETGPVSLGTFQQGTELILTGPSLPSPQPDQLYEITLEPAGGSPTGRPTGPILLKGFAKAPIRS